MMANDSTELTCTRLLAAHRIGEIRNDAKIVMVRSVRHSTVHADD